MATVDPIQFLNLDSEVTNVRFFVNYLITTTSKGTIEFWDLQSWMSVKKFKLDNYISWMEFLTNGAIIIHCRNDEKVILIKESKDDYVIDTEFQFNIREIHPGFCKSSIMHSLIRKVAAKE